MDNRKCGIFRIEVVPGNSPFHEITIEILRNYHFTGSIAKISEDYWESYISVYNGLIDKTEKVWNG
ncbi:MAG: hypothetical protein ACYCV0_17865 [Desulfitobacteriaceae bacterium]